MRNKKGLTLVEVVVAMGLFGIIMVALFPAFLITNLMNITSREFTDANYLAQTEIEEIYNSSMDEDANLITILEARDFDCSTLPCTKSDDNFLYQVSILEDTPIVNLTTVTLVVFDIKGDVNFRGDRAQIEVILRIGD